MQITDELIEGIWKTHYFQDLEPQAKEYEQYNKTYVADMTPTWKSVTALAKLICAESNPDEAAFVGISKFDGNAVKALVERGRLISQNRAEVERARKVTADSVNKKPAIVKQLRYDLEHLSKIIDKFSIDAPRHLLKFNTNNIAVRLPPDGPVVEFGQFTITMSFKQPNTPMNFTKFTKPEVFYIDRRIGTVTHPHIHNSKICLGEGKVPINNALAEGRIFDAVEIILSILNSISHDHVKYLKHFTDPANYGKEVLL